MAKPAGVITALDVVMALDGPVDFNKEDSEGSSARRLPASEHMVRIEPLWQSLSAIVNGFLGSKTLQSILDEGGCSAATIEVERSGVGRGIYPLPAVKALPLGPNSIFDLARLVSKGG